MHTERGRWSRSKSPSRTPVLASLFHPLLIPRSFSTLTAFVPSEISLGPLVTFDRCKRQQIKPHLAVSLRFLLVLSQIRTFLYVCYLFPRAPVALLLHFEEMKIVCASGGSPHKRAHVERYSARCISPDCKMKGHEYRANTRAGRNGTLSRCAYAAITIATRNLNEAFCSAR